MATPGKITQVIGSTFDAEFPEDHLPAIYNAVECEIQRREGKERLVGEVQQHLGGSRVRCVALGSTDGLVRGQTATDTGAPVSVPIGWPDVGRKPRRDSMTTVLTRLARRRSDPWDGYWTCRQRLSGESFAALRRL